MTYKRLPVDRACPNIITSFSCCPIALPGSKCLYFINYPSLDNPNLPYFKRLNGTISINRSHRYSLNVRCGLELHG